MEEELSGWVSYTGIQGHPSRYSKTDVEIGAKRIFDALNFKSGKSNNDRRRSFEEIWDASGSNPQLVAEGFDAAIRAKVYSLAYVKACIKNFGKDPAPNPAPRDAPPAFKFNMPKLTPDLPKTPVRAPRKKKAPNVPEPEEVDCGL
jgi:hypothetical protein